MWKLLRLYGTTTVFIKSQVLLSLFMMTASCIVHDNHWSIAFGTRKLEIISQFIPNGKQMVFNENQGLISIYNQGKGSHMFNNDIQYQWSNPEEYG